MLRIFLFLSCLFILFACKKTCGLPNENIIKIQFYDASTLQLDTLVFESIKGVGIDAVLYTKADSLLNTYELPASIATDDIEFVFQRKEGNILKNYMLRFNYNRQVVIQTPECGITQEISNLQVPFSDFDSIQVVSPILENNSNANIRIYF